MRIFALETNEEKMEKSFLSSHEEVVLKVHFHPILFIMRTLRAIAITLVLLAIGIGLWFTGVPVLWWSIALILIWIPAVLFRWLTALIDWKHDILLITSEEVVVVDQTSIFHVSVRQMNLDNIASVSAETQFGNILPFGKIHFDLKEGTGKSITLAYIPHAQKVASVISDTIVVYQRRKASGVEKMVEGVGE